jgi:hypothetical protein
MNLLTPKKVHTLKSIVSENDMYTAEEFHKKQKPLKTKEGRIGFIAKAGVFFRWTSYTLTILLGVFVYYSIFYGLPSFLRTVELSFIEGQVDTYAKSLATLEDKFKLQEENVASLILWQQEQSEKEVKAEKKVKK